MDTNSSEVLYYPNFKPSDLAGIKQSLLLYDRVNLIAPRKTPLMGSILADSSGRKLSEISETGGLCDSLELQSLDKIIGMIPDAEIIENRRDEFMTALLEDLEDPEVLAWEKQWKATQCEQDVSWFVLPEYFNGDPPEVKRPEYKIEQTLHATFGPLLRVPFLVGMSFGLSEALWAAVDRGYTLFTDDAASQQFLMLRLKRGWRRLTRDPELRRTFGIEAQFAERFAVAYLGAWILQSKVPELIKSASDMRIQDVMKLREDSRQRDALEQFRKGLAQLVQSQKLWEGQKYADFENEAFMVFNQKILPAFEELEGHPVRLKDVFHAVDMKDAISQGIKSIPDLFVGAAVPSAAAGTALVFGGHAVAPAALLALGCGLTAHFVQKLIGQMNDRLSKRRGAQFLAYPLSLQKALKEK